MLPKLQYFCLLILLLTYSCKSDDDYMPLHITTVPDIVSLFQNSEQEIYIFSNDSNIPTTGMLSLSEASKGIVEILDPNNTPLNPSDDIILYKTHPNIIGEDAFQYTICEGFDESNCKTETVHITINSSNEVVFNLSEVPYTTLSSYNFFEGNLKDLSPTFSVLPYNLNSKLFSDYAKKKRFVWIPNGVKASYVNDYSALDFPTGAVLIKNFYYDNVLPSMNTKFIETRLLYKTETGWDFANYVWNEEQTEAYFTDEGSTVYLNWLDDDNVEKTADYRIPSISECFTCHNKSDSPLPIGPKPQNLDKDYNYISGTNNQLRQWVEVGYLEDTLPDDINATISWDNESETLEMRVRSYLDINCAHCHSEGGYCSYRPVKFSFYLTEDTTNLGVCVDGEIPIEPYEKIIQPNNINLSLLRFRINTTQGQYRMPLIGRTLKHDEGVRLIDEWINSLSDNCN